MENKQIQLSQNAAKRITELQEKPNNTGKHLRITVAGGGCNGFRYQFELDDKVNDDDFKILTDGKVTLTIDKVSLELIDGSVIEFANDLGSSYFKVTNPNATSSCGCGDSFSV